MENAAVSDLDREIAKKLRRRWWKKPLLLSGTMAIASSLFWLISQHNTDVYTALGILSAMASIASSVVGIARKICSNPIKNIQLKEAGNTASVTYYSRDQEGATVKKWKSIQISTDDLFYEPGGKGAMVRGDVITFPYPEDFIGWFRAFRDAEAKRALPIHRVLPPAPQLAPAPTPTLTLETAKCRVCGEAMEPDRPLVTCGKCQTPHHKDCWAYIGKCSVFNCGESNYQETKSS